MPDLAHFNQQVLLCQDDAYTLAWYLLGSETQAEAATQAAVLAAYHQAVRLDDCRTVLLRQVVRQCKRRGRGFMPFGKIQNRQTADARSLADARLLGDAFASLQKLPDLERQALVLVDILGLSGTEAAAVLGCPVGAVQQHLAQGRRKV
ncbi:MAG: hypothetical protein EHM21_09445 [Chloroflexi bacterium]|nr:MAG: hypothetical protein EHM21_09445 [Chloroflexota bacterium]